MSRARKYSVIVILVIVALVSVQAGVSVLVRTHRMRAYLTARLEARLGVRCRSEIFHLPFFQFLS